MAHETGHLRFSPRILDHLGLAAYNSVPKSLAELSANGYDADATEIHITVPDVINGDAVIEVEDDGVGMSAQDLKDKFLFIGRNKRADGQRTAKGRLVIGSKGIGKLAGFGIAGRVEIVTWKDGVQSTISIDRHTLEDLASVSEHPFTITTVQSAHPTGTKVRLFNLNPDIHPSATANIRRQLFRGLPKEPGFRVLVNDVECTAEDIDGVKQVFETDIPGAGRVSGFYIVASARQQNPGLAVRVRGRIVQEPSVFGLDTRTHWFFSAEKVVGEINADFLDPEDPADGSPDLINTARNGFIADAPQVAALNEWAKTFLQDVLRGIEASETTRRTNAFLASPEVKQRLERMPEHVRGTAAQVVRAMISRVKNVSDEDVSQLVEWILRYYESNVLRELMRAIIAADAHDAEKLAALVHDWGVKQVSSVAESIRTQIEIITKLEELVESDAAKEMDLHKLIEANLWLIREGLETWSSDKPLKVLLEKQIDTVYAAKANLRPDLVCKSRDDGKDALILEFKRPKETIVMAHVTQALEYEGLIKAHRPGIKFATFVVGREYDPSVMATRDKLQLASLHLWSFSEILQRARGRFETILDILGK